MINKAEKIEMVDINEIKENPRNPNRHDKEGIERLKKNIKAVGFRNPLVISKRSNLLIVGHGRLKAARDLGFSEVPVIYEDFVDEAEEYQHMTADNALAQWSHLEFEQINKDIIDFGPFDIDLLGIKDFVVEALDKYADKDADAVPEQRKTDIVLGDLFQLGEHRLLCGDGSSDEAFSTLLDDNKIDLCFCDPPYGVSYQKKTEQIVNQSKSRITSKIHGDDMSLSDLKIMLQSCFNNIYASLADKSSYYVCSPQGGELGLMMMMMMQDACIPCRHMIIWVKNAAVFSMGRLDYDYRHEPILYGWSKNKTHEFLGNGDMKNSVWEISREPNKLHPTMKPVAIPENAIKNSSKPGMSILDPFGGSGTTLIASEKTNRKCFMMEIDPSYCQVIVDRWEKFTGKKAVKI